MDPPVSHPVSVPGGTQDTPFVVLQVRDSHPLRWLFPQPSPRTFVVGSPTTPVDTSTGLACSTFARHYSRNPLFSSGYSDVSLRPVPSAFAVTALSAAGFPHSDTSGCSRLHTPDQSFSQCTASFFGAGRPGIPRVPLFAADWRYNPSQRQPLMQRT